MKKPSDAIAWLWNNTLGQWFLLVVVALAVLIWIWVSTLDLYNLSVIVGLVIAAWHLSIAKRQDNSMKKGQYSDRFAKTVEQITSDQLVIRLGGLTSIEALSKETEDEFKRVWQYLGHYLRYPPELAQWSSKQEQLGRRPDIAAVATMLRDGSGNKTHLSWMEKNQLPLEYANLQGADLQDANLQGADLQDASLQNADLHGANLQGADLQVANLQDANLQDANLQNADLRLANLQGALLIRANLQGADLRTASLQGTNLIFANLQGAKLASANLQDAELIGANLQDANLHSVSLRKKELQQLFSKGDRSLLKGALFSLEALTEASHIKDLMPEKMSEVYYLASKDTLPDYWPGYRPCPITYRKWLEKKKHY